VVEEKDQKFLIEEQIISLTKKTQYEVI